MYSKTALLFGVTVFFARTDLVGAPGLLIATDAIQPQSAIDDKGNVYVVFIHHGNISVAVSKDKGKSFSQPVVAIDTGGRTKGGLQRGPRIGLDKKSNIYLTAFVVSDEAEYKNRYPAADLCLVSSQDGSLTWTKPLRVNEISKKAPEALHWLAVSPAGEAHIAWLDIRSRPKGGQDLYYARVTGGKVGKNIPVAAEVCQCCAPGLTVDSRGNPFLAYREGGSKDSREIFATYSADRGTRFAKPVQINKKKSNEAG